MVVCGSNRWMTTTLNLWSSLHTPRVIHRPCWRIWSLKFKMVTQGVSNRCLQCSWSPVRTLPWFHECNTWNNKSLIVSEPHSVLPCFFKRTSSLYNIKRLIGLGVNVTFILSDTTHLSVKTIRAPYPTTETFFVRLVLWSRLLIHSDHCQSISSVCKAYHWRLWFICGIQYYSGGYGPFRISLYINGKQYKFDGT